MVLTLFSESKNSSQHNQAKKNHKNGYDSPPLRPRIECRAYEIRRSYGRGARRDADGRIVMQYQEAKDQQIPFAQGNRPEVQEKPQTCAARYREGFGTWNTLEDGMRDCEEEAG